MLASTVQFSRYGREPVVEPSRTPGKVPFDERPVLTARHRALDE